MASNWSQRPKNGILILELRGALENIKTEIESGLIKSIRNQARGEVMTTGVAGGLIKPHRGSVTCTP
jgi:hypothetical protein